MDIIKVVETKTCTKCKQNKSLDQYDKKRKGLRSYCKACVSKYTKQHYKNNRDYYLKKAAINRKKGQARLREYLFLYKKEHPCVDCGESDPVVLEFDHIRNKADGLARMATRALKLNTIIEEINKCDVVCANCHKRRTAKAFNWVNK